MASCNSIIPGIEMSAVKLSRAFSQYVPTKFSLGGLIYGLRALNSNLCEWNRLCTLAKNDKYNKSQLDVIRPHIDWFSYYSGLDLPFVTNVANNKLTCLNSFHDNTWTDIHLDIHNGLNSRFKQSVDWAKVARRVDWQCMRFAVNITNHMMHDKGGPIKTVLLDNNHIYNLSLVKVRKNHETPMHGHDGLCVYKMMDVDGYDRKKNGIKVMGLNTATTAPVLIETKYLNHVSTSSDTFNKNITTTRMIDGDSNILYTNEFYQFKATNNDCYYLILYFHEFGLCT